MNRAVEGSELVVWHATTLPPLQLVDRPGGDPDEVTGSVVRPPSVDRREARQYIPSLPMPLFRRVCHLGSAGFIFLLIWRRTKLEKKTTVGLSTASLSAYGFSRKVKDAALRKLERVGLIRVTRSVGKNPLVTLLTPP